MARDEALMISEELFDALSPTSGDLDWEYVWPLILVTQDLWIQPILGIELYEKIMEDIKNSTLVDPYKTLVDDYIGRTAVWYTVQQGMPWWAVKVVNSGVVQRIVDDGTTLTFLDIDKLTEFAKQKAEFYKERLIRHLCNNSSDYPEYKECNTEGPNAESTNYMGGLNLETYGKPSKAKVFRYDELRGWL